MIWPSHQQSRYALGTIPLMESLNNMVRAAADFDFSASGMSCDQVFCAIFDGGTEICCFDAS